MTMSLCDYTLSNLQNSGSSIQVSHVYQVPLNNQRIVLFISQHQIRIFSFSTPLSSLNEVLSNYYASDSSIII